jgi:hypothetical protein
MYHFARNLLQITPELQPTNALCPSLSISSNTCHSEFVFRKVANRLHEKWERDTTIQNRYHFS